VIEAYDYHPIILFEVVVMSDYQALISRVYPVALVTFKVYYGFNSLTQLFFPSFEREIFCNEFMKTIPVKLYLPWVSIHGLMNLTTVLPLFPIGSANSLFVPMVVLSLLPLLSNLRGGCFSKRFNCAFFGVICGFLIVPAKFRLWGSGIILPLLGICMWAKPNLFLHEKIVKQFPTAFVEQFYGNVLGQDFIQIGLYSLSLALDCTVKKALGISLCMEMYSAYSNVDNQTPYAKGLLASITFAWFASLFLPV